MDGVRKGMSVLLVASLALSALVLASASAPARAADHELPPPAPAPAPVEKTVEAPAENQDFEVELRAPKAGSARAQALAVSQSAGTLTLYSLEPWRAPEPPAAWRKLRYSEFSRRTQELNERSQRETCQAHACIDGNRVLGSVEVGAADRAVVAQALRDTLGKVPNFGFACDAQYRHAVAFADGAQRYEVLLCYHCGQVKIRIDGEERSSDESAYEMGDLRAINAILTRAGVTLAKGAQP